MATFKELWINPISQRQIAERIIHLIASGFSGGNLLGLVVIIPTAISQGINLSPESIARFLPVYLLSLILMLCLFLKWRKSRIAAFILTLILGLIWLGGLMLLYTSLRDRSTHDTEAGIRLGIIIFIGWFPFLWAASRCFLATIKLKKLGGTQ